jgi:pyrimidine deaminase RibD-like protein
VTHDDVAFMHMALDEARKCDPSPTAYSVGCVISDPQGRIVTGRSREEGPTCHAEEVALRRAISQRIDLSASTLYTTLEPCGHRASKPKPCATLIMEAHVGRVVYAAREPERFSTVSGAEILKGSGMEIHQLEDLSAEALAIATRDVPGF